MFKVKLYLSLFLLCCFVIPSLSQDITPIAVIDLDAKGLAETAAISLSNVVRRELIKSGIIKVKSEGYSEWQQERTVKKDETIIVNATLAKPEMGRSQALGELAEWERRGIPRESWDEYKKSRSKNDNEGG